MPGTCHSILALGWSEAPLAQKSEDELGLIVEQMFLAAEPDDIAALTDTTTPFKLR